MKLIRIGNYQFSRLFFASVKSQLKKLQVTFNLFESLKTKEETFSFMLSFITSNDNFQKKIFDGQHPNLGRERYVEIPVFVTDKDLPSLKDVYKKYGYFFCSYGADEELAEFCKEMSIDANDFFIVAEKEALRIAPDFFNFATTHEIGHILLGHLTSYARRRAAEKALGVEEIPALVIDPNDPKEIEADLFAAHVCGQELCARNLGYLLRLVFLSKKNIKGEQLEVLEKGIQQLRSRYSQIKYYFPGTH